MQNCRASTDKFCWVARFGVDILYVAQAAAAAEAKSQFLARMSHEIRTPLNGMIAVGQLLAETALSPAQWDLVNTVRCSGETLLTLISDILDFSRIEVDPPACHATILLLF